MYCQKEKKYFPKEKSFSEKEIVFSKGGKTTKTLPKLPVVSLWAPPLDWLSGVIKQLMGRY